MMNFIGILPINNICKVFILLLSDEKVFFSDSAKNHVQIDHPDSYFKYSSMLPILISRPQYIGVYLMKDFAIELVTSIKEGEEYVLVGINLKDDANNIKLNTIASFYEINVPVFNGKIKSGRLKKIPYY